MSHIRYSCYKPISNVIILIYSIIEMSHCPPISHQQNNEEKWRRENSDNDDDDDDDVNE